MLNSVFEVKSGIRSEIPRNTRMDNEEFTTCPYNAAHRIRWSRLPHHLMKCQKSYPDYWICPFNACHRFPEHLKEDHYINCPDKPVDKPKPKVQTGNVGALSKPQPISQKEYLPDDDPECEYWD